MEAFLYSKLLIREVEKYPCLYDINCNDYADRELKKSAWMAVAEKVAEANWDQMDETARSNVVKELRMKWKNLKDTFMRSLRIEARKIADGRKPRKPYIYRKQMAFLRAVYSQSLTLGYMNNHEDLVNTEASEAPSARAHEPAIVAPSLTSKKMKAKVSQNANANESVVNTATSEAPPARTNEPPIVAFSRMPNNRITDPFGREAFRNMYANGFVSNEALTAKANGPAIVASSWMPRNRIGDPFGREIFPNMIANRGVVNNEAPAVRTYDPALVALSQMPNRIMTYPFEKGVFRNMNDNVGVVNTEAPAAKTYEPTIVASSRMAEQRIANPFEKENPKVLHTNMGQRDADEMFLMSQLPYIKKMKINDKLQFQMQFLQLVHTYSNTEESTAVQNSSPVNSALSSTSKGSSTAELDDDSVVSF